jgi:dihydroorotate dehydrogenase
VIDLLARLGLPFLLHMEPERAHRLGIAALRALPQKRPLPTDPRLRVDAFGLAFPNPLGLAAGFDKNAEVPDALIACGLGFAEVGTVTPRPQQGNPKPRVFRLPADAGLINRLGFNNEGQVRVQERLRRRVQAHGIVGVNIGANRDSADRIADYVAGVARFASLASYLTINISSPNTPGLRALQGKTALAELLERVGAARAAAGGAPILVKIAPDLDDEELAMIAETASGAVDGIIVANTTIARDGLIDPTQASEAGGLSGHPLFHRSTVMLAKLRKRVPKEFVLVGVGGIDSAEAAWAKITAGADLIQLYTGLIYEGPGLPAAILAGLSRRLDQHGLASIGAAVGSDTERWPGT